MRRLSEAALAILALAVTGLVVGFGVSDTKQRSLASEASSWRGLVGGAHPTVAVGQRVLVVLRAPSLAQRVAQNGGLASERQERTWTRIALAAQQQLLSELSTRGIRPRVEFSVHARPERLLGAARRARDRGARSAGPRWPASTRCGRRTRPRSRPSLLGGKGVARGAAACRRCGCPATTAAA